MKLKDRNRISDQVPVPQYEIGDSVCVTGDPEEQGIILSVSVSTKYEIVYEVQIEGSEIDYESAKEYWEDELVAVG